MIDRIRRGILHAAYPLVRAAGKAHAPWTHKKLHAVDVDEAFACMKPGDTIVTYTYGEFTNLVIPGRWKHVAMYVGEGMVVEAKDPCVRISDIYDFLMTKDYACAVRPDVPSDYLQQAVVIASGLIGKPYDYFFELYRDRPNPAFYCAELPYWCYAEAMPEFPFTLREVMGVATVKPDDYFKADKLFGRVWSNLDNDDLNRFMKE